MSTEAIKKKHRRWLGSFIYTKVGTDIKQSNDLADQIIEKVIDHCVPDIGTGKAPIPTHVKQPHKSLLQSGNDKASYQLTGNGYHVSIGFTGSGNDEAWVLAECHIQIGLNQTPLLITMKKMVEELNQTLSRQRAEV